MRQLSLFILLLFSFSVQGQDLKFELYFKNEPLKLNKEYNFKGQPIVFTTFKFYLSNIVLSGNGEISNPEKQYHLLDIENPSSLYIPNMAGQHTASEVQFNIGIDSAKSISGAYGGDLDPTNGMYWAWQSGYINCKIEGISPLCPARKNKFQFHLGGYAYPNNCLQKISLRPTKKTDQLIIRIELADFIKAIDLKKQYQVMSPSVEAVQLSKLFSETFNIHEEK